MSDDKIPYSDARADPEARAAIEQLIMLMRMALAPIFNGDPESIPMNQSYAMTAAAMFAGMTAGHMIGVGVLKDQDMRRTGQMVLANFRNGVKVGKAEAHKAILEQTQTKGMA